MARISEISILLIVGFLFANFLIQQANAQDKKTDGFDFLSELFSSPEFLVPFIIAVVSGYVAYRSNRSVAKLQNELDKQKKQFESKTDYEWQARKRIYEDCSPLIFTLVGLSESALFKISDIVNHYGRNELVIPGKRFGAEGYNFFKSSVFYRLFAPMACFKLLQGKLTAFDLNLNPRINIQYMIAKHLYYSFSTDREYAKKEGRLEEYEKLFDTSDYSKREGLWAAEIDTLCESFIVRSKEHEYEPRLKRFDEFNMDYRNSYDQNKQKPGKNTDHGSISSELKILDGMFSKFDIEEKSILWKILVDQSRLYLALVTHVEEDLNEAITKKRKKDPNIDKEESHGEWIKEELLTLIKNKDGKLFKEYLNWEEMGLPEGHKKFDIDKLQKEPLGQVHEFLEKRFKKFTFKFKPEQLDDSTKSKSS